MLGEEHKNGGRRGSGASNPHNHPSAAAAFQTLTHWACHSPAKVLWRDTYFEQPLSGSPGANQADLQCASVRAREKPRLSHESKQKKFSSQMGLFVRSKWVEGDEEMGFQKPPEALKVACFFVRRHHEMTVVSRVLRNWSKPTAPSLVGLLVSSVLAK